MRVVVAGASGLVGSSLVPALRAQGHDVAILVRRSAQKPDEIFWDPAAEKLDPGKLNDVDTIVNLAGAGLADARWTRERMAVLRSSRIKSTQTLVTALGNALHRQRVLINASAVGYYGNRGSEVLTEASTSGNGFLADLCVDWERSAYAASPLDVRVVCLRLGVVLSSRGGMIARLKPLFRLGLGGKFGDGRAWMSWITCEDLVRLIGVALDDTRYAGSLNAVAPWPVSNADFTGMFAAALNRPSFLTVPAWALKVAFGPMAEQTILSSARVLPATLRNLNFDYKTQELPQALMDCL